LTAPKYENPNEDLVQDQEGSKPAAITDCEILAIVSAVLLTVSCSAFDDEVSLEMMGDSVPEALQLAHAFLVAVATASSMLGVLLSVRTLLLANGRPSSRAAPQLLARRVARAREVDWLHPFNNIKAACLSLALDFSLRAHVGLSRSAAAVMSIVFALGALLFWYGETTHQAATGEAWQDDDGREGR
jgi:hypothetical protein